MRQELLALQRRLGLTTLFVTHDQEEAMTTADRMAVLDQGVVQQVGTPTELYDEPVNSFVAGFVGTMNLLPATVRSREGGMLTLEVDDVGGWQFPDVDGTPAGPQLYLSVRPHALHLQPTVATCQPELLRMAGTIEAREFLGPATRYRVRVGNHSLLADHPHHRGVMPLPLGSSVSLGLVPAEVRLLAV